MQKSGKHSSVAVIWQDLRFLKSRFLGLWRCLIFLHESHQCPAPCQVFHKQNPDFTHVGVTGIAVLGRAPLSHLTGYSAHSGVEAVIPQDPSMVGQGARPVGRQD